MSPPTITIKVVPARGASGSNRAIIAGMRPAIWVTIDGKRVLQGDSFLAGSRAKTNSFYSSARKMGLGMVRRREGEGTRCWVIEKGRK